MPALPPDDPANPALGAAGASPSPGGKVGGGRFTLQKILGQGGMGVVWLAQDERLGEPVALKFLPPQLRFDPAGLASLRRETLRSLKLSHPNIVRVHDLHEPEGGDAFLAMEFVDGPTLSALRLQQPGGLFSWAALAPLVKQLCDALDYAHGERVIHRDLKPSNLMLDGKGRLKLADFGIATVISDSLTRLSGTSGGTPVYMSPQQMNGQPPQPTDDIYSLGATLYELLTGTPPFHTGQIVHQVLHNPPTTASERLAENGLKNEIPPAVEAMLMACLAKDPAQRPQSARAVADWIGWEETPHPRSLETTVNPVEEEKFSRDETTPARGKLVWAAVAIITLLAVAGGWFLVAQKPRRLAPAANVAVQSTPASASPTTAPPAARPEQVVYAEDFENFKAEGDSKSGLRWAVKPGPGRKWSIESDGGNHFMEIESDSTTNWLNPAYGDLDLRPEWKKLKFSWRTRTRNLKCDARQPYSGAALFVGWWFPEVGDGWSKSATQTAGVNSDHDWIPMESTVSIPAGSKHVGFTPIIAFASGIADFDDIKITLFDEYPSAAVAAATNVAQRVVTEDFEDERKDGKSLRWDWGNHVGKFIVQEDTNHFARLEGNHWTNFFGVSAVLPLQPGWKILRFSCRFRTQILKTNPDYDSSGADLLVGWVDEAGAAVDSVGINRHVLDQDWKTERRVVEIPARAKSARIYLALDHATGIADFENVRVDVMAPGK